MCSKVVSSNQEGGGDWKFNVKLVWFNYNPNIVTFQLITGDKQFYILGIYIPPNCTRGVEDLWWAGEACLAGCKLAVLGDLNVYFGFPQDKWEKNIVDHQINSHILRVLTLDSLHDRHQGPVDMELEAG
jgi:hypothetical protein